MQNRHFNFQDSGQFLVQNEHNGTDYTPQLYSYPIPQRSDYHLYYDPSYNPYYLYPSYHTPYSYGYNDRRGYKGGFGSGLDNAGYFEDYDGEYAWDFE
ncbi:MULTISPECIES: hypothetical protein [unclassified Bacillus cereus group]|uniref:hypothetical protein n=1 Tax=unclassified Bacillus cereus group TaxID=2750818 RepID=UPI001F563FE4|nr:MULTISPECIES: hypothetical protein [unclassified Bacillus cereus group]